MCAGMQPWANEQPRRPQQRNRLMGPGPATLPPRPSQHVYLPLYSPYSPNYLAAFVVWIRPSLFKIEQ